jgi:hypothetical protein
MAVHAYLRDSMTNRVRAAHEQRQAILGFCRGTGLLSEPPSVQPFWYRDEASSGSLSWGGRPAGGVLLRNVRRGDVIVVAEIAAVFRTLEDLWVAENLTARGVRLLVVDLLGRPADLSKWPVSGLVGLLRAFVGLEKCARAESAARTTADRLARGEGVGSAPYGFRYKATCRRLDNGRVVRRLLQVPDEAERRVMAIILEWRETDPPWSYDQIRQKLDFELKVPTRSGRGWTATRVKRMHHAAEVLQHRQAQLEPVRAEVRTALAPATDEGRPGPAPSAPSS